MYKAFLSLRYLRTRYIAMASIVSVMLGVATMIVVNSVMKGFTSEMRGRIQGLLSDIVIETNSLDGQENARQHFDMARKVVGDKIAGMTATVEVWGLVTFNFGGQFTTRPITLIGIQPDEKAKVGPLVQYLESYQTLKDGKRVIRDPLRSLDEPPTWNLTAQAKAWRHEANQRRKWIEDRLDSPHEASGEGDEFHPRVSSVNHTETSKPAAANAPTPPALLKAPTQTRPAISPTLNASATKSQAPKAASAAAKNPFEENQETSIPVAKRPPVNEDDPQAPRIYIGAGLIRFPYEDPKTGERRMIEMVRPGEDVTISTVSAGRPPTRQDFVATVVDVFKCGMSEYDSNLVFCNLEELQKVRSMVDPVHPEDPDRRGITSIQIKLKDFRDAPEVIERLQAVFSPGIYTIKTWEQKQGPLLAAVEIETGILNVLLFLIIAVAGFGILAIFYMIVVEKTRDIGILKSLGASSSGVMSIFLSYGLALGVVGSGVGVLLGLFFVRYINELEALITAVTGRKVFDDKIYYFPEIPTLVQSGMVFWVTCGAIAIAVMASVLPARRAARLRPVEALRYE
ncbi:MAG TPA: FtsX-like permease family protein [Planctomycetaceae bacterium]|jgi:lipoprotein-releasing system permease protein|nr:FtsX-like permease family protein [Planctomycetaceae bacterium]